MSLEKLGVSKKIDVVISFHEVMKAEVRVNVRLLEENGNGLKWMHNGSHFV